MSKILMPIKPEYVEKIMSGRKKYEYRKTKPKKSDINKMIIYSTFPVMKVVGEVEVNEIIVDTPERVWNITEHHTGISKETYDLYYKNKSNAIAYKLGKVKKYDKPLELAELGINYVPQSFVYLD
ncbi:MAG: ASCH domain-containing protein [Bacilli bacterium]